MLFQAVVLFLVASATYCSLMNVCETYSSNDTETARLEATKTVYVEEKLWISCEKGDKGETGSQGDGYEEKVSLLHKTFSDQILALNNSIDEILQGLQPIVESKNESNKRVVKLQKEMAEYQANFTRRIENFRLLAEEKPVYSNCDEIYRLQGATLDGVYTMANADGKKFEAYCEFDKEGNNWMIIQKRFNGEVDFTRNWTSYVKGFGKKYGEYWLGLENIYKITSAKSYTIRVDLENWNGEVKSADYQTFSIGSEDTDYRLNLGSYASGSAPGDSLLPQNNQQFSTIDRDNDDESNVNCAAEYLGGWWYKGSQQCATAGLNGKYRDEMFKNQTGIVWSTWSVDSLKAAAMKIRPG